MQRKIPNYRIGRTLATGAFGSVCIAFHDKTREEYAIKCADDQKSIDHLKREASFYQIINGSPGFPTLHAVYFEERKAYLIIDLLGKNLQELLKIQMKTSIGFSLKTVLMLADQALLRLEYIHTKGIVHGDIKPENFCIGLGSNSNQIYLIDFGLARNINDQKRDLLFNRFEGTASFASLAAHKGEPIMPKDDIESLVYTLIFLLNGKLPWSDIDIQNKSTRREVIAMMKRTFSLKDLYYSSVQNANMMDNNVINDNVINDDSTISNSTISNTSMSNTSISNSTISNTSMNNLNARSRQNIANRKRDINYFQRRRSLCHKLENDYQTDDQVNECLEKILLPSEVINLFQEMLSLNSKESPNYSKYRNVIRNTLLELGHSYDSKYDWSEYRIHNSFSFQPKKMFTQQDSQNSDTNKKVSISNSLYNIQSFSSRKFGSSTNMLAKQNKPHGLKLATHRNSSGHF
ncbi:hypothetical protein TRFO_23975 [Tritrichomonas foetus]|uniref:non-specific serine/threonine protein kinase n=1 Tax=Tritrichomonas foetus TaxID=1144522 RepID=A0A1J4KDK5_9EUKA|nr:hypothetical protein TRFO_23975 [Tritrichomonas foetus]|eukprot:OHT07710.1 hypothetical protein TRFO_23975 [Tritrichomonas foetus]